MAAVMMRMNHRCDNFVPKRCDNCQHGNVIKDFSLVECAIYDDLMCIGDVCPLWE